VLGVCICYGNPSIASCSEFIVWCGFDDVLFFCCELCVMRFTSLCKWHILLLGVPVALCQSCCMWIYSCVSFMHDLWLKCHRFIVVAVGLIVVTFQLHGISALECLIV